MDVQSEGEQLTPICPYLGFWRDFDALPEHIRASVRQVVRDISKGSLCDPPLNELPAQSRGTSEI
jgi:hypothetical protein